MDKAGTTWLPTSTGRHDTRTLHRVRGICLCLGRLESWHADRVTICHFAVPTLSDQIPKGNGFQLPLTRQQATSPRVRFVSVGVIRKEGDAVPWVPTQGNMSLTRAR